jgi:hypothetical protein
METLMLESVGNLPLFMKDHIWHHNDANIHSSPSCTLCSHHPCFMLKAFSFLMLLFLSFHNLTSYTMHYHGSTSSHHCTARFINIFISQHYMLHTPYVLSQFYIFTLLHYTLSWLYILAFHHASSTLPQLLFNCLCVFCFFVFFLQSYCFVLLCNFLLVCGDHCPRIGGLSPLYR